MYVVLRCGLKIPNTKLSRGKVASYYWLFFSFLIYVSYSAPILGHTACACSWSTGEDHAGAHVRGDWSWCSISQQWHTLSLKEGRQSHFNGMGLSIQLTFTQQWRETSHSASHGQIIPQSFWSPVSTDQTTTTRHLMTIMITCEPHQNVTTSVTERPYLDDKAGIGRLLGCHWMSDVSQFNQQVCNVCDFHLGQRTCTGRVKQRS